MFRHGLQRKIQEEGRVLRAILAPEFREIKARFLLAVVTRLNIGNKTCIVLSALLVVRSLHFTKFLCQNG